MRQESYFGIGALALFTCLVWIGYSQDQPAGTDRRPATMAERGLVRYVQDTTPPLGAIIAWHKNLKGVPQDLPKGWMECSGGKITVGPMAGETAPNLNGGRRFLRGGASSGTEERD